MRVGRGRPSFWAVIESLILVGAFLGAVKLRFVAEGGSVLERPWIWLQALVGASLVQVGMYYSDLYEDSLLRPRLDAVLRLVQAFFFATVALSLIYYALPVLAVGRGVLLLYLPLAFILLLSWRAGFSGVVGSDAFSDSVLVLGTGQTAQQVVGEIVRRSSSGYRVVGFLGLHPAEVGRRLINPSVIGTIPQMPTLARQHRVNRIVVALEDRRGRIPMAELLKCRLEGVKVEEATAFLERLTGKIPLSSLRPSALIFSGGFSRPRFFHGGKRAFELVVAVLMLIVLAPVALLVALLVRLDSRGPVLYRQERVGAGGRPFLLLKFRTMRTDAETGTGPVWASEDRDPRITRIGRLLRTTRLDELPQLINVLRGEMSFIGPRPERPHFVEKLQKVIPYYGERHTVKPGITGWAQIKFGYGSTLEDAEEKLEFDLYYIKHMSPLFDLRIVLDTLKVMIVGRGAR